MGPDARTMPSARKLPVNQTLPEETERRASARDLLRSRCWPACGLSDRRTRRPEARRIVRLRPSLLAVAKTSGEPGGQDAIHSPPGTYHERRYQPEGEYVSFAAAKAADGSPVGAGT